MSSGPSARRRKRMRASREFIAPLARDVGGVEEEDEKPRLGVGRHLARLCHGVRLGRRRQVQRGRRLDDHVLEGLDFLGHAVLLDLEVLVLQVDDRLPAGGRIDVHAHKFAAARNTGGCPARRLTWRGRLPWAGWPWAAGGFCAAGGVWAWASSRAPPRRERVATTRRQQPSTKRTAGGKRVTHRRPRRGHPRRDLFQCCTNGASGRIECR